MRGIGVVNLVHSSGEDGECHPIDFRIYKEADGKSKTHFQEMLLRAVGDKQPRLFLIVGMAPGRT